MDKTCVLCPDPAEYGEYCATCAQQIYEYEQSYLMSLEQDDTPVTLDLDEEVMTEEERKDIPF